LALCIIAAWAWDAPRAGAQGATQPAVETGKNGNGLEFFRMTIPGSTLTFEMIRVPAGKLTTATGAADGKERAVEVKSFWIGKTEVTFDEYSYWFYKLDMPKADRDKGVDAQSRPSPPYGDPQRGFGSRNYPAISPTYNAAVFYCKWLSAKTGRKFRLPTEEEWEYAARAGGPATPPSSDELRKIAWFRSNSEENGVNKAHECATLAANAWGLHDMLGNAAEWCSTLDAGIHGGALRGGHYDAKLADVNYGARLTHKPSWQTDDTQDPKSKWWLSNAPFAGFRLVCDD
jgi:formylglycine-generating enzyme required for sulfatase activity